MFHKKGINIGHPKDCWNYLKDHFQYFTMNSWNQLKSIANKVKVYDLPFRNDPYAVLGALQKDDYNTINTLIWEWESRHKGYSVGFNGRSSGYLVLYNAKGNGNILPTYITDYDSYEDFKREYRINDVDLRFYTKLVRDFDKLCDALTVAADEVCDSYPIEEE